MLFALTYLTAILAPGFLLHRLLNIKTQTLLFSTSFSLAYFVILIFISLVFNISVANFYILYIAIFIALLLLNIIKNDFSLLIDPATFLGYLLIFLATAVYMKIVGFYDELPSDVYIHLEHFKNVSNQLDSGAFFSVSNHQLISKSIKYWYHLPTLISKLIQVDFIKVLSVYSAVNIAILLACIYEFSLWLFQAFIKNKTQLICTALLSSLFFALHFGINVFAFIRYYAIAPTILNLCIYLFSIVLLIHYYQFKFHFIRFFLLSSILFFTAFLIHAQEALFIGTMYFLISMFLFIHTTLFRGRLDSHYSELKIRKTVLIIFPALVLAMIGIYVYSYNNLPLSNISLSRLTSLNSLFGFGDELYILDPFKQFYRVLTHWGLFVCLLYVVFYHRYFKNQPVLLSAMIVPLVTIFNPIFVELFLRISSADVLWRFLYMLPLYLIAARIAIELCLTKEQSMLKQSSNLFIVFMIFLLLLPIKVSSIDLPYSRIYSLLEVEDKASSSYWQDMLDYLQTLPDKEIVITDPVTGYLISAMTKHHNRRYKFHRHTMLDSYEFEDYTKHPLEKFNGKLFIVNQRVGESTPTAKIARHWNPNNLNITEFYSQNLLKHIVDEPNHFNLLWEAQGIKIYRITY